VKNARIRLQKDEEKKINTRRLKSNTPYASLNEEDVGIRDKADTMKVCKRWGGGYREKKKLLKGERVSPVTTHRSASI